MPKIKILNLPKYLLGGPGECAEGEVYNEFIQQCVPDPNYDRNAFQPPQQGIGTGIATNVDLGPDYNYGNPINKYIYSDGTPLTEEDENKCPKGYVKNAKGECVPKKTGVEKWADFLGTAKTFGSALAQEKTNRERERDYKKMERNKAFTGRMRNPGRQYTMGNVETQSGVQFPGSLTPPNEGMFSNAYYNPIYPIVQFGGTFGGGDKFDASRPIKIKILEAPEMKYGGQFEGSYGLDVGWRNLYTDMSKTDADHYGETLSEDKDAEEPPVLEAEGGETLYKPGDGTLHKISGKRHSEGGVKLTENQVGSKNSDISSFIFSDTNKMKIKDKDTLDHFGVTYKKGGVTPAFISKKYDLNKYRAILDDPNKDPLAKATAQMMIEKNEKRLAELAAIQEGMKGVEPPSFVQQKLAQVRYGGFVNKFANGGPTDPPSTPGSRHGQAETKDNVNWRWDNYRGKWLTDDDFSKKYEEAGIFTPEQLEAFGKHKKTIISEKAQKGDVRVPKMQPTTGEGLYGDVTLSDVENLRARHPWYFKDKPNWNPKSTADVGDFQREYNEKYAKKYGYTYFVPKGSKEDRKFNRLDEKLGEYTYNAPALEDEPPGIITTTTAPPAEIPEPRYICIPDGKGGGVPKQLPAGMTGGYATPEEAMQNCPGPGEKPPFDYLLPDKVNMLAKAAIFPEVIFPMIPQMASTPTGLSLEDWRAPAATAFSVQYAAPAQQLAQYTSPQGLTANLSALAGQAAQNITGQIMPGVIGRNVDRVNTYSQAEANRQDQINMFNLLQRQKGYEGWATARQQYKNALRGYLKENSDAFTRAWNNRMQLGLINATNSKFYLNPTSGANIFYNPNRKGIAGLPSGGGMDDTGVGTAFDAYYAKAYDELKDPRLSEEDKKKAAFQLAMDRVRANRYTETVSQSLDGSSYRTSRRNTGFDFDDKP